MSRRVIRRGQLIAPFGPGAMVVTPDGVSLIAAGLDHWFKRDDGTTKGIDPTEFRHAEWRLERELGVDYFSLPPDFRKKPKESWAQRELNLELTVPFLRFPRWHVCRTCHRLVEFTMDSQEVARCPDCKPFGRAKKPPRMVQVRFVAMCDRGHIQDFPWREWVHETPSSACSEPMKLTSGGGSSLAAIKVTCKCGASRTLDRITDTVDPSGTENAEDNDVRTQSTFLTKHLAHGQDYFCEGLRPWLGEEDNGEGCDRPLRGSLRGATNVHFSVLRSSIYLPRGSGVDPELMEIVENPRVSALLSMFANTGESITPSLLRDWHGGELANYSDHELAAAISAATSDKPIGDSGQVDEDDPETAFRRAEFGVLRTERREEKLQTRPMDVEAYDRSVTKRIARVTLVETLQETRALTGFARVFPENDQGVEERKAALWKTQPKRRNRWLPAYIVHGEGIYIELEEERLQAWELLDDVKGRVETLNENYGSVQSRRHLKTRTISPRLVMVHTVAHLLMNQLTFECGYSTASLRERLYVSTNIKAPMAGLLIYTAAGDAEGTMGGLVRMGKPGNLEPIFLRALQKAQWCSTDPVCMELGARGQGPDSCNLAACHNCGLVPETSCEEFNRFLDRGLVVGTFESPDLGYFADAMQSAQDLEADKQMAQ